MQFFYQKEHFMTRYHVLLKDITKNHEGHLIAIVAHSGKSKDLRFEDRVLLENSFALNDYKYWSVHRNQLKKIN